MHRPGLSLGLGLLAFLILFHYEIARPAVEATFTADYGYEALRWAWLIVPAGVFAGVAVFNRFAAQVPLLKLLAAAAVASAALLAALLLARGGGLRVASYGLYVFKDVHIVFLVEAFWMLANAVFQQGAATWLYGLFCAAGSVGGFAGASVSTWLIQAQGFTTDGVLWTLVGVLGVVAAYALVLNRGLGDVARPAPPKAAAGTPKGDWRDGFRVLGEQKVLAWLLVLVVATQLLINLVDYQLNGVVEAAFPARDDRTVAMNEVYRWISVGALAMQVLTGPLLKALKFSPTFLMLPFLVGGATVALLVMPRFLTAAVAKVTTKVVDYSLFRATKEILYLPLGYAQKTQGKAVIDILGYRSAKAGAAAILFGLGALGVGGGIGVGTACLVLVAVWIAAALAALRAWKAAGGDGPAGGARDGASEAA
ncbi:MAG: hypothetical protein KC613_07470 [Myxococcales bacterium]|nr:hypothetical protein [Myxococcales bacterium]MCB9523826.1 hypothetical protein [Myxococcales bacterium]